MDEVKAGNIVGIGGLEEHLVKTGIVTTYKNLPNFVRTKTISMGLVKVAIEAKNLSEMSLLKQGLEKLNRADPSVEFYTNNKGQFILETCGEVHLERCVHDLLKDYSKGVEISISEPIIPFKETIINNKISHKKKKKRNEYEQIGETSSDDEEEEKKTPDQMTLDDYLKDEYLKIQEKLNIEREFFKKEQTPDMYIEKIL